MGKLQEFQRKISWDEDMFMPSEIPSEIFHYTSPMGFESILFGNSQKIELWASRYDCLNDYSEGTLAKKRFKNVCEFMYRKGELTQNLYDLLIDVQPARTALMWHQHEGKDILTRPEYTTYICSFSSNSDSLAMWNYYSKGSKYEGFNLGFYSQDMLRSISSFLQCFECNIHMYPVVYEEYEQDKIIHDFICEIIKHYEEGNENILRYLASNQLSQWSLVFKSKFFKHEEEIRLIIDVGVKKYGSSKDIPQLEILYRISNGYTIPYIKLQLEKFCLSSATIGPLLGDSMSKENQLEIFGNRLSAGGYSAIGAYSEVPVRF